MPITQKRHWGLNARRVPRDLIESDTVTRVHQQLWDRSFDGLSANQSTRVVATTDLIASAGLPSTPHKRRVRNGIARRLDRSGGGSELPDVCCCMGQGCSEHPICWWVQDLHFWLSCFEDQLQSTFSSGVRNGLVTVTDVRFRQCDSCADVNSSVVHPPLHAICRMQWIAMNSHCKEPKRISRIFKIRICWICETIVPVDAELASWPCFYCCIAPVQYYKILKVVQHCQYHTLVEVWALLSKVVATRKRTTY